MDFIRKRLDGKIRVATSRDQKKDIIELNRVKIEYYLFCMLGALWNKYYDYLSPEQRENLLRKIRKPSIGSVIDCISTLDDGTGEILNGRDKVSKLQSYTKLRNARVGHGYIIGDFELETMQEMGNISKYIEDNINFVNNDKSFVIVEKYEDRKATGIIIKPSGDMFGWSKDDADERFKQGSVLTYSEEKYYKVDPFIFMESEENVYLFKDIADLLSGTATMNSIFIGDVKTIISQEFRNPQFDCGDDRVVRPSGTVSNKYKNNYVSYITIGTLKKKIMDFLRKDRASVAAVLWGHGGVGKTALIQSVCDDLYNSSHKDFDYIIFTSAKNVKYNIQTGNVDALSNNISSFEDLINAIGSVMYPEDDFDAELILDSQSRVLIIIDDFETFPQEEKTKISSYLAKMDIDRHKVVITTRALMTLGVEFQTNELTKADTKKFLEEIIKSDFYNNPTFAQDLISHLREDEIERIFDITSGRPLFILQLLAAWKEMGDIREVLDKKGDLKSTSSAIQFLYGRMFDYLSVNAKKVFTTMGALIDGTDDPNLIEKVSYALDMQDDDFETAINELVKLKMIELTDNRFFRAYSREIAKMMTSEFYASSGDFQDLINSKLEILTKDKNLDNHTALLQDANLSRSSDPEETVTEKYLLIINSTNTGPEIRLEAIRNLAEYLASSRGKIDNALNLLRANHESFANDPEYFIILSDYCVRAGQRDMAVKYIRRFVRNKPEPAWNLEAVRLEMSWLLLMHKAIIEIERREEIINSQKSGDRERQEANSRMREVISSGGLIFAQLKESSILQDFTPRVKQNILAGLNQYVTMCYKMYRLQEAIDACKFAIRNFPTHMTRDFGSKLRQSERKLSRKN
ncbi:hypothetical protein Deipr_1953 [Deinococcus proteolyticus MRP]|uniref:NACHT domain-containing protein n=1 Tax=Deinococcus proteolyticus (strain ATCC 35074 / DSM 20540 / JCM 6276 / NBRC 101906 / NCIMB 13154 / VKM Ac-1939 / CCM 2703 / MRP) TaxID=693977 RepID=F0RME7_DEIPM|nr:NACHT domain-containing protein [Deinococcus proteolyticus]ADY27084.1 hypothetical protein Deipr_1953 [Deinococcus proteolyticus MRP]